MKSEVLTTGRAHRKGAPRLWLDPDPVGGSREREDRQSAFSGGRGGGNVTSKG